MFTRRHFIITSSALVATPAFAALDAKDPDIKFGTTGSIYGVWNKNGDMIKSKNMRMMLMDIKHYGLEGFEPYSDQAAPWYNKPLALKALAPAPRPAPGAGPNYSWLGGEGQKKLIADMEACARDFLQPLGIDHWKNNMGPRPPGGPSTDQLKGLVDTANEIGMRTKKYGVRLSLHPHMWGPMEREHDFRYVMEHSDPNYVYMIMDTGHNVLGGMDVVKISDEFFPRITEFHLKDTFPQYRGNKGGPTPADHKKKSVYASVGQGGGVDFPGVFAVMRKKHFKGWAVFDIDAPRPGDGTGSVDDNIAASVNYMRTALGVKLPAATGKGGLFTET
ncbi:MAG: TIM barrel protein [Alphaproteobacteria bacterium]|nr:TIM barrel protein [Alphaproteobacteria bacterium]